MEIKINDKKTIFFFYFSYLIVFTIYLCNLKNKTVINAGNSGTLARCIIGLCSATNKKIKLIGDNSLSKRDFSRVIKPLNMFGVKIKSKKK